MTTMLELPPLAEAMSAADLRAHQKALECALGGRGEVYFNVSRGDGDAGIQVYPQGIMSRDKDDRCINAPTWPAAIQQAADWIAAHKIVWRESRIRKLALTIIDVKDEAGRVTAADLTRREFTAAEVRELHAVACIRAGELCAGAPFSVEGV